MAVDLEYCSRVRHILVAADTRGIPFRELNARVRTPNHPTADLRQVLNAWKKRKWVDNFERVVPTSHQHSQIWRATQLLLDEWPMVQGAVGALLLAPDLPLAQDVSQTGSDHPDPSDHQLADEQ